MKRLKLKKTGEEVRKGNILVKTVQICGIPFESTEIEVNDETIPDLIKEGVLMYDEYPGIEDVVGHLAQRKGWKYENLDKYLSNLYDISPSAVFEILLKEIAVMLDEKYPDHISKSDEIYTVSRLNGSTVRVRNLKKIRNFRNFAAFRTAEDAETARKILAVPIADLYGKE